MFASVFNRAAPAVLARAALPVAAQDSLRLLPSLSNRVGSVRAYHPDVVKARVLAVLGSQWGDEGKGKLVDVLAKRFDMVARFNGGSNAGHTLVVDGKRFAFHLLPCGLLYPGKVNIIGNGVVLHVPTLLKELANLKAAGVQYKDRLLISDRAHLLFDFHQTVDAMREASLADSKIGTTKKGIGPCTASKATRNGVRVGSLLNQADFEQQYNTLVKDTVQRYGITYNAEEELQRFKAYREELLPMITDTSQFVNAELRKGKTLLAEGANAAMLDIDHGTYPFVTSSSTTAGGMCTGLGIAPSTINAVIGVVKAYTTRVGSGPFPTEDLGEAGDAMQKRGVEVGTTTGRKRRCGWLDLNVVAYSHMLNGYSSLNITKLDVLTGFRTIKLGVGYKLDGKQLPLGTMPGELSTLSRCSVVYEEMPGWDQDISKCKKISDLPKNAQAYLNRMSELLGIRIDWVGVGTGREDMATQQ